MIDKVQLPNASTSGRLTRRYRDLNEPRRPEVRATNAAALTARTCVRR